MVSRSWAGGADSYIESMGVLVVPSRAYKIVVLVPLSMFSLKKSTVGALAVPYGLESKKHDRK